MTFDFICYRGDSVCSISESDTFRGQVECREDDTVFVGFFQLSIWFVLVVMIANRISLGSFLKCNNIFGRNINIHECCRDSLFAMWCRVSPVLVYLMKPILASR